MKSTPGNAPQSQVGAAGTRGASGPAGAEAAAVTALHEQRRRKQVGKVVPRLGIALAVVTVAWLIAWTLGWSTAFIVRKIEVEGVEQVDASAISGAVSHAERVQLIRIDSVSLATAVEALPPVADATVAVRWPSTLTVRVKERVPVAQLQVDGVVHHIDGSGVWFRLPNREPAGPVIDVENPASNTDRLKAAAAVAESLPEQVRQEVVSIAAPSPDGVTLTLSGDRTVVWGGTSQTNQKARVLAVLLTQEAQVYDVSAPGQPVTRARGSAPAQQRPGSGTAGAPVQPTAPATSAPTASPKPKATTTPATPSRATSTR